MATEGKTQAATLSVMASAGLAAAKLTVALLTGSLAVLSDALHSLIDLAATIITWFAVRLADKPADDNHHYGHAKIESLAALFEAVLLGGTGVYVGLEAMQRLFASEPPPKTDYRVIGLLLASMAVDFWRSRSLKVAAEEHASDALAADALHFTSDMIASFAVVVGLLLVMAGFPAGDALAALFVSAFIIWLGFNLARGTLATLLDQAPVGATSMIREVLTSEGSVLGVETLRVRQAGTTSYVNLVAQIPRSLSAPETQALNQRLVAKMRQALPQADLNIRLVPVAVNNETVQQKVLLLAASQGLAVHHVSVQDLGERLAVSFDIEMEANLPLGEAHEHASKLEDEIRHALGGDVEVESHLEPQPHERLAGKAASAATLQAMTKALGVEVRREGLIQDVHNIRLRQASGQLYLHYHCRFEPSTSLDVCHAALDRVEQRLMTKQPKLARVIAHAEPLKPKL